MNSKSAGVMIQFIAVTTIVVLLITMFVGGCNYGYRAGQIDAIEGKVKYQPTTQTVYVEREVGDE